MGGRRRACPFVPYPWPSPALTPPVLPNDSARSRSFPGPSPTGDGPADLLMVSPEQDFRAASFGSPIPRGHWFRFERQPLAPPARSLPRLTVSVVIPCYNEERALPYLANTLRRLEDSVGGAYDLRFLLVDDGSTDATLGIIRELFGEWPNVTVLRHDRNRGLAAAIQTGALASTTEIVCSMDCDCTYDPHELARMIPRLRLGIDLVVASPYHRHGSARSVPRWRRALARSLATCYRALLRQPLTCYTSSFRVYRRSRLLALRVRRGGFIGVTETLARLDLSGATIVEHPVTIDARTFDRTRLAILRGIAGHLGLLAELAWLRARRRGRLPSLPPLAPGAGSLQRVGP